MQVNEINQKINFKNNSFYDNSAGLEKNVLLSRALIAGVNDVFWISMANNKVERQEKARRLLVAFAISFLSPILTLPFSNRLGMKYLRLTKSFFSSEHKAIHLSGKYLINAEKTKEGLEKLALNYTFSPIEKLSAKIKGKNLNKTPLNFEKMLKECNGDYEKLRQKLINLKAGILASDYLFTIFTFGSLGFINNKLTKQFSGQSGFSAEFSMADKKIVEERAATYEKNRKKRYALFSAAALITSTVIPLALKKGLSSKDINKFTTFIKKYADKLDYTNGIYMSRLSLLLGAVIIGHLGTFLATRNKTELKDTLIRYTATDTIFMGGDLALSSLFAGLSDRIFKTNLSKSTKNKFEKIFPKTKSLTEISEEVKSGKIPAKNKSFALYSYWANLGIVTLLIGIGVPKFLNAVIRRDVRKDVEKRNAMVNIPTIPTNSIFQQFKL